jgi:hypothetical protein
MHQFHFSLQSKFFRNLLSCDRLSRNLSVDSALKWNIGQVSHILANPAGFTEEDSSGRLFSLHIASTML